MTSLFPMTARLAGILLLGLAATAGQAAEETVEFDVDGQTVVGTLETPETEGPAPVVLLLHGFTGTRDELPIEGTDEGVLERTARLLAEGGYASLRIDFRGSGDSDGEWAGTTFSGQTADAVAAVDWLTESDAVDTSRVSVLGWSQGGLVAAHAANERPDIDTLILWAPVVHPLHTYSQIIGADAVAEGLSSAPDTPITATLPWGAETTLNAAFFQEFALTSTAAAAASYEGPLLVIVGTQDTTVAPQPASGQVLVDYHDGDDKLEVFETDHVWGAFGGPETLDEKMLPATLDWLRTHSPA